MEVEKIYFDMDGVLADFDRGVIDLCGITPLSQNSKYHDEKRDDAMWAEVKKIEHFYDVLELKPGAKEMFDAVYGRYGDNCEILTGIPKPKRGIESAADDKVAWVRRLLSDKIVVNIVYSEEKPRYCTGKGCILIDDRDENIRDWIKMGGTGIMHMDSEKTLGQLKEMGVL